MSQHFLLSPAAKTLSLAKDRKDRRLKANQSGKRQVVVVMRETKGRTLTYVTGTEAEGVSLVAANVARGTTVHADEASHWDKLAAYFPIKRINHKKPIQKTALAPIRPNRSSRACVALRSGLIITLLAVTLTPTPLKWLGAKIAAVNQTAPNTRWYWVPLRWLQNPAIGVVIGRGRRVKS